MCPQNDGSVHTLKAGTILQNRYFVGKVLGEGGFGITYLGFDTKLQIKIAIKEFYPQGFVLRETQTVYHCKNEEFIERGKERFLLEARRLSKFCSEPGIVSVRDVFNENNTAYIIMEFIPGASLLGILKSVGKISEKTTLEMFEPIIKTLIKVHSEGIIHRDIAPDNIMVRPDGNAKLIDFGAAIENSDGENNNKSTVALVKHGYAPEELYDNNHSRQGTWSDVYSLSATIYRTITGLVPPDAIDRLRGNLLNNYTDTLSPKTKSALFAGMALKKENRIQNMSALYDALYTKTETVKPPKMRTVTKSVTPAETPVIAPSVRKEPAVKFEDIEPTFIFRETETLYNEACEFILKGNFRKAQKILDKALIDEPQNAFLWWTQLLIELGVKSTIELKDMNFKQQFGYVKAYKYADPVFKKAIDNLFREEKIRSRL
jgi:serine/threonine protein kinase